MLPLKTKQGKQLVKDFQKVLFTGRKPTILQTDQGTEFLNRVYQKFLRINKKALVVERFNRTFKNKIYKYFTAKDPLSYINLLPQLVSSYSNTCHRGIKMKPSQVTKASKAKVWDTLYGNGVQKRARFTFQVGDRVSFSKVKRIFGKSYPILRKKLLLYTCEWLVSTCL